MVYYRGLILEQIDLTKLFEMKIQFHSSREDKKFKILYSNYNPAAHSTTYCETYFQSLVLAPIVEWQIPIMDLQKLLMKNLFIFSLLNRRLLKKNSPKKIKKILYCF